MKSKASACCSSQAGTFQSQIQGLKANGDFYVACVNALVDSFFGSDYPKLGKLEELPSFVKLYELYADEFREKCDVPKYYRANQIACLLKKLELPSFKSDGVARALTKWHEAEAGCKEMNERCWDVFQHPLTHQQPELASLISKVRREIADVVGEIPPDLPEVVEFMNFGPGASASHSYREGASPYKIIHSSAYIGMEDDCAWLYANTGFRDLLLGSVLGDYPAELVDVRYVDHAVLEFVPKSIAEMRTIEVGPSLATFVQNGYDGFIRRRLHQRWGIDLSNQGPNKVLACVGSVLGPQLGSPCTIDLSAASDRIPYGLVALLFSKQWTRTMSWYRAKKVRLPDGNFHTLEKFSSMGNALTFSVQTLIYGAVVRSVLRDRGLHTAHWRCYGDDIIVPYDVYEDVVGRLQLFGFVVNETKSFSNGWFRESCGGDYLLGTNVRPLYIKTPLVGAAEFYKVLNLIQLHAKGAPIPVREYRQLYSLVLSRIPKQLRLFGDASNAPDSCIWTPTVVRRGKVLAMSSKLQPVPERIGYWSCLLDGYEALVASSRPLFARTVGCIPSVEAQYFTAHNGVGLEHWTAEIIAHTSPGIEFSRGLVVRRAPKRGAGQMYLHREEFAFDPVLMD